MNEVLKAVVSVLIGVWREAIDWVAWPHYATRLGRALSGNLEASPTTSFQNRVDRRRSVGSQRQAASNRGAWQSGRGGMEGR